MASPLQPWDSHNQRLVGQVRPAGWANPTPAGRYNLVVLGGGTAGLVAAAGAVGLGAKVALVEKHFLGGDCLNTGCVPSKALLKASRAAHHVRIVHKHGIRNVAAASIDFGAVMERVRQLRADLSPHDSARRFSELGVEVFFGAGRFASADTLEVEGQTLAFATAVIATGARPAIPNIPGLSNAPYLTSENLFNLTELPRRLTILGAGPVGCEMAQAFARLGADVTLITRSHGILPREDRDGAERVRQALEEDGVRILCCATEVQVLTDSGRMRIHAMSHDKGHEFPADQLLVAVGRTPNTESLGLETAGIGVSDAGIVVDDFLRTTNPRVYACGDVCSHFQFTHAADFMARTVLQNALFLGRQRMSSLLIPRCTYTAPEIAHIGLSETEASKSGIVLRTWEQPLRHNDRAVIDGETDGFVRIHTRPGTDQILGATIVSSHAGELIGEIAVAMRSKMGLRQLASVIHPYPTQGEAIRKIGDAYNRTRLTPTVKHWMQRWLAWRR